MTTSLGTAIFWVGFGQLSVLVASALVPIHLEWRNRLSSLPTLVRQLFWVYGGYVVMSIIALGTMCLLNAEELASGTRLARTVCLYAAVFWGVRLSLQPFLATESFLTSWWLRSGYHLLTLLFASFTAIYIWAVFH